MNKYYRVSPIVLLVLCSSILISGKFYRNLADTAERRAGR